jgi:hypothetical protein
MSRISLGQLMRLVKLFSAVVPIVALVFLVASNVIPYAYAPTVIALDSATSSMCSPCGTTLSWSHTVGFGSNRILVVGTSINHPAASVTGVTYGATSLALIMNPFNELAMYYLLNPPVGTATVTVTFTNWTFPGSASAGSESYFNVASVGASASNTGAGSPTSVTVASSLGMLVVDLLIAGSLATPISQGSGQTYLWGQNTVGAGSSKVATSPTTTMTWTLAGNAYNGSWGMIAAVLVPSPITTPPTGGPVGGFMETVNKSVVFAPYLALFGIIAAVAVIVWKKPGSD